MLFADKAALENRTKVRLLAIREQELNLYVKNLRTFGTVSAFMAGIAQSAMLYTKRSYVRSADHFIRALYCFGLVILLVASLKTVHVTTSLCMLAPGHALRGPEGAMHTAVDGLIEEFQVVTRFFYRSFFIFLFCVVFPYAFLALSPSAQVPLYLCSGIGITAALILYRKLYLERMFPLESVSLVSGAFFGQRRNIDAGSRGVSRKKQTENQTPTEGYSQRNTSRSADLADRNRHDRGQSSDHWLESASSSRPHRANYMQLH